MNPEAVAVGVATELSKEYLNNAASGLSKVAKNAFQRYFTNFEKHLAQMYLRNKHVKILSSKDEPVDFEEIYVNSLFKCATGEFHDNEVVDFVLSNKRAVVSANGGAGKTFLMRHLWMTIFNKKESRVPIFIELRRLNSLSTYDIESFIRATAFGTDALSAETFKYFCEQGQFIFALDGFDEVVREKRNELEKQIISLSQKYPKCGLIVSGRPDDRFDGWQTFTTFRAVPFDYGRFKNLIEKIPFDRQIKKSFLGVASEKFFDKHESFLSNPLLAIMMLLTFRDNAEIPTRLSTFYENCFATLYSQHDALKESYHRKRSLDQATFKRTFSVFCLFTYIEDKFSLNEDEFIEFLEKTKSYLKVDIPTEGIEHDFLETVNLLVKDGRNYSFIHRSFQEYFSAYCVTSIVTEKNQELLELFARRRYDQTFLLAYESHPEFVEDTYLIPKYRALAEAGCVVSEESRTEPFLATAQSGLSYTVGAMAVDSRLRGRRVGGLTKLELTWNKDFEGFFLAALRTMVGERAALEFTSTAFDGVDRVIKLLESFPQKGIRVAKGVEVFCTVSFTSSAPHVSFSYSKEYKRPPASAARVQDSLKEELEKSGQKFERLLAANWRTIQSKMAAIEADQQRKKATISDFFDL